jgi:hypothetical protein
VATRTGVGVAGGVVVVVLSTGVAGGVVAVAIGDVAVTQPGVVVMARKSPR